MSAVGLVAGERDASACGRVFFHPPSPAERVSDAITDERMLLSVSTTQTTLYDQIRYAGSPSSFAWVLPIHGTVTVGLSADVLFDSVDALTATQINPPPSNCPLPATARLPPASAILLRRPPRQAAAARQDLAPQVHGPQAAERRSLRHGAASLERRQRARQMAHPERLRHPRFHEADHRCLRRRGLRRPGEVAPARPGRAGEAPRARHFPGRLAVGLPLRMASVGTGAIGRHHHLGRRRRPLRAAELRVLPRRRQQARLGLQHGSSSNYTTLRVQQEATLTANAGWEIESSLDAQRTDHHQRHPERRAILRRWPRRCVGVRSRARLPAHRQPGGWHRRRRGRRRRQRERGAGARRRHRGPLRRDDGTDGAAGDADPQRHRPDGHDVRLRAPGVVGSVRAVERAQRHAEREPDLPHLQRMRRRRPGTPAHGGAASSVNGGSSGCATSRPGRGRPAVRAPGSARSRRNRRLARSWSAAQCARAGGA